MKLFKFLPFSYLWTIRFFCGNPKTVLDLGCGDGKLMSEISDDNWKITGIDIYKKSAKKALETGVYKDILVGDIVKISQRLIKSRKRFDLVFCSQAIEHIDKKEGMKLLDLGEKLSKERIFFATPIGFMHQPKIFIKGNPYQHHKSGWSVQEFEEKDYKVFGVGFWPSWNEYGLARSSNIFVSVIGNLISVIFSPLVLIFPSLGAGLIAVKNKK